MTRKISHSDIKDFQSCEYKWFYGRYKNLTPAGGLPDVMQTGLFGHDLMEEAFKVIMAGGTFEEAANASGQLLMDVMDRPLLAKVYKNVLAFVAWFQQQEYRVVGIEEKQSVPVALAPYEFGFTPDIRFEFLKGPYRGQQGMLDYKFTGQYWSDREVNAFNQVPKYILYHNKITGDNIRHGGVVMLNTRATATDTGSKLFIIKWLPISKYRLKLIERENEIMLDRVYTMQKYGEEFGEEELKLQLVHAQNEKTCKFCFFADDLCPMDQMGKDTARSMRNNYKQNTQYGYNGELDPESRGY
jgi:hypothetical protein